MAAPDDFAALLQETAATMAERGQFAPAARLLVLLAQAGRVTPSSLMLLALCSAELGHNVQADELFTQADAWLQHLQSDQRERFVPMRDQVLKVLTAAREQGGQRALSERAGKLGY
jgi:hypothetical protein